MILDAIEAIGAAFGLAKRTGERLLTGARREEIKRAAKANGWLYLARDDRRIKASPFPLFTTHRGVAVNIVTGTFAGREATVFDYNASTRHGTRAGTPNSAPRVYTCIELPLAPRCPHVEIFPALSAQPGLDLPIPFESEQFRRTWRVRSPDRAFATALTDARMMDYLLSIQPVYTFELSGPWLLVRAPLVAPAKLADLAVTAIEFRDRLPSVLDSLAHGTGA